VIQRRKITQIHRPPQLTSLTHPHTHKLPEQNLVSATALTITSCTTGTVVRWTVMRTATAHDNKCEVWHTEVKSKDGETNPRKFLFQSKFSNSDPRKIQTKFTLNEETVTRQ
jgi:hypothetical protein